MRFFTGFHVVYSLVGVRDATAALDFLTIVNVQPSIAS